jgi:hypothetical protein
MEKVQGEETSETHLKNGEEKIFSSTNPGIEVAKNNNLIND